MKVQHSASERRLIEGAFARISNACDRLDMKAARMLEDALRHERRERSSLLSAKALLVESFRDGWKGVSAASLYSFALGCRSAALIGAEVRRVLRSERSRGWAPYASGRLTDSRGRLLPLFAQAVEAHSAAIRRALEAA